MSIVLCLVAQSVWLVVTLWTSAASLLCPWGFSRQECWSGLPFPSLGDLPNPGIRPRSPTLQVDSLPSEPPGKPRKAGVGSLSLLQGNFPTQKLNWGLLHCRQILYQLSYWGAQISIMWDQTQVSCIVGVFFTSWATSNKFNKDFKNGPHKKIKS